MLIAEADATAYGAAVTTQGRHDRHRRAVPLSLPGHDGAHRPARVPATVPVPHVESLLTFDYDVSGRFSEPFIAGRATFAPSEFLGATVGAGTVGSIDTQQQPLRYTGEGDVNGINLRRFGEGLEVAGSSDPRYAGTVSGHFRVDGTGTSAATLALTGGGRLSRADLFKGTLSDADVSIAIARRHAAAPRTTAASPTIDPSIPFADPRLAGSLTGSGTMTATVRELLTRPAALDDYDVQRHAGARSVDGCATSSSTRRASTRRFAIRR